jgi:hypothetical protein
MFAGGRVFIVTKTSPDTPAYNIYIDNIYCYCKGMSDLNYFDSNSAAGGVIEKGLANGVTAFTAVNAINPTTNGALIGTDFELGTTMADNNFIAENIGWTQDTNQVAEVATSGRLSSSGSLSMTIPNGTNTDGTSNGGRVRARPIAINGKQDDGTAIQVNGSDAPDLSGTSYYGVSFWMSSDAADVRETPTVKLGLWERRPTLNQVFNGIFVGPSAIPVLADGWHQFTVTGPYPELVEGTPAMSGTILTIDYKTRFRNFPSSTTEYGPYVEENSPGAIGDATVYIDDIVLHKVKKQEVQYYDHSLFD